MGNFLPGAPRSRNVRTFEIQMADEQAHRITRGARITALRGTKRQRPIAAFCGVTIRAYQFWEKGGGIGWERLQLLASYHGVSPNWIEHGDDTPAAQAAGQLDRLEDKLDAVLDLLHGRGK